MDRGMRLEQEVLKILQDNGVTGPGRLESLTPSLRARIRKYAGWVAAVFQAAPAAPEAASAEGSPSPSEIEDFQADLWAALLNTSAKITPSHTWEKWMKIKRAIPSSPSQDSQEVREAIEAAEAWLRASWFDSDDMNRESAALASKLQGALDLLSQSPKGAAGAGIDKAALTKELFDFGKAAQLASDDVGLTRMALRSAACILKLAEAVDGPSAPKTGLRGAAAPGENPTCAWHSADTDTDLWETACGRAWSFTYDGPIENEVKFCIGCGKPVEVLPEEPAPDDMGEAGGGQP